MNLIEYAFSHFKKFYAKTVYQSNGQYQLEAMIRSNIEKLQLKHFRQSLEEMLMYFLENLQKYYQI